MTRQGLAVFLSLSVALALSACAGSETPSGSGAPPPAEPGEPDGLTEPAPPAPAEPPAPPAEDSDAWPATPSCGRYERGNEPTITAVHKAANRCMLEAFRQGLPAQVIATYTTIEGDPTTNFVRVLEDGRVEIYVDGTRDAFGSGRWEHYQCQTLSAEGGLLGWSECEQLPQVGVPTGLPAP